MLSKLTITSEVVTVTPELAVKWLECNTHNRPISQNKVNTYAADMKNGKWELNGEPIIFDNEGTLQDGQHRLWASVESHSSFKTVVTRGTDPATFKTIDTGKARLATDVLAISGYKNVTTLSSAARLVMHYRAGTLRAKDAINNGAVLGFVDKNPGLTEWVHKVRQHKTSASFGGMIAAVTFLASHRYATKADEFIHQFATGENLPIGAPVLALRNRLLADKRLKKLERFMLIILTWNAFISGRSLSKTQMPHGNDVPKIAGAEK